jgi:hypothetical protein
LTIENSETDSRDRDGKEQRAKLQRQKTESRETAQDSRDSHSLSNGNGDGDRRLRKFSEPQYQCGRTLKEAGAEWRLWRPKDMDAIQKRLGGGK